MKTDAEYLADATDAAERESGMLVCYRPDFIKAHIAVARNLDRGIDWRRKHPEPKPFYESAVI